MTLRHFRIFAAVCDEMNMTEAAGRLFISQSAVSQAIAELENYYGVRFFERFSRKLYLTPAGEKLLSYVQHIIQLDSDIEKYMKSLHENGLIRFGASVTVGTCVLPKLISRFKHNNPDSVIEVYEDNTENIEKKILGNKIDIGLIEGDIVSQDLNITPFMDDELILVCSKSHRFSALEEVEPRELEKESFIIREAGSGTRRTFEDIMNANNFSWKSGWICNNVDTIKAAVAEGLGISVISGRAVENEVESGILLAKKIKGIQFKRNFKIIFHKNKYLTEPMKSFINLCCNSTLQI